MQLEINGNKVGLIWGLGCFEIAAEIIDGVSTIDDVIFSVEDVSRMSRIAWAAIQNWCDCQSPAVDNPITLRAFQTWLDNEPEEVGTKITEDFLASKYQGRTMKERYDEVIEMVTALAEENGEKPKKKASKSAK